MEFPTYRTHSQRPYLTAIPNPTPDAPTEPRLPRYRTTFVGREASLSDISHHLANPATRLVTIVGRSGVGKTRLAIEAAHDPSLAARGGAVLVELANAREASDVARLLAEALETGHVPGQPAEDAIRRRLRRSPAVVIADDVDNVPGAAEALLDLLSESPRSVILATAHRRTGIAGERVVRLAGLEVPMAGTVDAGRLLANPAVELYADRAAAVDPSFRLTRANTEDVAELARRLDGLPLAIELGAARATILSPRAQLLALEGHSPLELRSRAGATRPERHRDVRSAVAVSYGAASEPARLVLRRMSVAADAVTADRVRDLVTDPGWSLAGVLDALGDLVDLGLADVDRRSDGEPRFRLHPTVAAYGRERLGEAGEEAAVQRRYASAVLAVGRAARSLPHERRLEALSEAAAELHAVFAALADGGDADPALELAADLSPLWARRGLFQGPGSRFEALLAAAESGASPVAPEILARAQLWWTRLVIHGASPSAHRDAVVARLAAAAAAARAAGDEELLLFALDCVVWSVFVTGDLQATSAAVAEGLPLAGRLGNPGAVRRYTYCAAMLANLAGDPATAVRYAAPALDSAVRDRDLIDTIRVCTMLWTIPPGTPGLPPSIPSAEALLQACLDAGEVVEASLLYATLAGQAVGTGRRVEAARWAIRGLDLAQQLGAWYAGGLTTAALVLLAASDRADATVATLHGALTPVLREVTVGLGPHAIAYRAAIAAARERMGGAAFDQAVADASILDRDAAIDRAAAFAQSIVAAAGAPPVQIVPASGLTIPKPETPGRPEHLTPRELDILRALMTGATNGAIAKSFGLRPKTVMHHSVSIYAKLGVRGRTEATAWAYRNGLAADRALETPETAAS